MSQVTRIIEISAGSSSGIGQSVRSGLTNVVTKLDDVQGPRGIDTRYAEMPAAGCTSRVCACV